MPKQSIVETRRDFSGGLNVSANPDALNANELMACVNARVETFGGIMRRPGSKKIFTAALADGPNGAVNLITAVIQWDAPTGKQLVLVSDSGALYYAASPYTSWTLVNPPGGAILVGFTDFATFRDSSPGAPLCLFFTNGHSAWKWTGSVLTNLTGINGVPAPSCIRAFGTRLFMNDTINVKSVYWSKIGNGTDFRTGGSADGGSAIVDTLTGDGLVAFETIGASLLLCTNEAIARFTGIADDIQILQDTQGVSAEIGPNNNGFGFGGPAICKADHMAFLHSERGMYVANEGTVLPVGDKITDPNQVALRIDMNKSNTSTYFLRPIVAHNPRRSEVWMAYVPLGATQRSSVLVYNYRSQCWYGPFEYSFGIYAMSQFEDATGIESIIAGCDDGFVRLLDDPTAHPFDDGTADFDSVVIPAPFGLESPYVTKSLDHVYLQVMGKHTFGITASGDLGSTDIGAYTT